MVASMGEVGDEDEGAACPDEPWRMHGSVESLCCILETNTVCEP